MGAFFDASRVWAGPYTGFMKFIHTLPALVLLSALGAAAPLSPSALAATQARGGSAALAPVEGEVIVQFKADASVMRAHALSARAASTSVRSALAGRATVLGARVGRTLEAGSAVGERSQVMRASGISAQALAALLAQDPEVEFAEPNGRQRIVTAPNDPLYAAAAAGVRARGPDSGQWYLRKPAATLDAGPVSSIDIEAAWARTIGNASVVVAVLDTGVRRDHPDLAGRLLPGYDFVSDATVANDGDGRDADPSDPGDWVTAADAGTAKFSGCTVENSSWHGTSTASLVGAAANDGIGMAGAAPGVSVLPVRVLGKCFGTDSDIQAAMRWAAGISVAGVPDNPNPAKVLNLSLGSSASCSNSYQTVVNEILARGVVIVAAAGNSAGGPVGTPGSCNGVIAVLALRHAGTKVGFSDLGLQITIAAPGGNCINITAGSPCLFPILAATNTGLQGPSGSGWTDSFKASVGTSFSSPLVAATAGLMFSAQPALTPAQVRTQLQATARAFPTTGGDNGDSSVVAQCQAPSSGVQQLQCYCNTSFCGAGMLDAGAAVASVAPAPGPVAAIETSSAVPTAGVLVTLTAQGSTAASGSTIATYQWTLIDGGGIVTGFTSATNAVTASLMPTAAGSFTVALTVTDNLGRSGQASRTVTVVPAAQPPVTPPPSSGGGGGGGGSMSAGWVALLVLAALALLRSPAAGPGGLTDHLKDRLKFGLRAGRRKA